jgi:PqqD family protein of HPr-rel-A system
MSEAHAGGSHKKPGQEPQPQISQELAFSQRGFLFDPRTGLTYTLNKTGAVVFNGLRDGSTVPAITANLVREFEVETDIAERDVKDFVQQLTDFGLL